MPVSEERLNIDIKLEVDDYKIFMAINENLGKDNSGEEIYEIDKNGERKLNEHNHLIQKHDLDDIVSAFEKLGKENGLSFRR